MAIPDRMQAFAANRERQESAIAHLAAAYEAVVAEADHVGHDRNALFFAEVDSLARMLARRLAKLGHAVVRGEWSYRCDVNRNTLVRTRVPVAKAVKSKCPS
jgi:hypothetical protein